MKTPSKEWMDSARRYIRLDEPCDCDCWRCQQDDHFENHCEMEVEDEV